MRAVIAWQNLKAIIAQKGGDFNQFGNEINRTYLKFQPRGGISGIMNKVEFMNTAEQNQLARQRELMGI